MNWLLENYQSILAIIGGVVSVASMIVALTPTKDDDAFLDKIISFLEKFSIVTKRTTV